MTFKEALDIIVRQRGHGNKKSNLSEVKKTAAVLGLKKLPFKIILVAGTNGKGTTSTLLSLCLSEAGFKTGLFTSPHLFCITERIKIDGSDISKKDFGIYVGKVLAAETVPLKFFEVLTLAAILYFKDKGADFAVVEVGIGGRLDCTNIFPRVLNMITSVDMDHCDILGNTLKDISWQKGGIIKNGVPCICGKLKKDPAEVISKIAKEEKSDLEFLDGNYRFDGCHFKSMTSSFSLYGEKFKVKLLGEAQAQNAALACMAAKKLGIETKFCKRALMKVQIPCRFEVIPFGRRYIIKDGAHNPAAFCRFIETYSVSPYCDPENTLVYAAMKDKDYKTVISLLSPYFKRVVLTCADPARGVAPAELKRYFPSSACVKIEENPGRINLKSLKGNIIIAGSFYLCAKMAVFPS